MHIKLPFGSPFPIVYGDVDGRALRDVKRCMCDFESANEEHFGEEL